MLWDLIYDFFIQYIFGGYDSTGTVFTGCFGYVLYEGGSSETITTADALLSFKGFSDTGGGVFEYMSFGNYLSLIATIITLVAILLACVFLIKKIIGVMFRLFTFGA